MGENLDFAMSPDLVIRPVVFDDAVYYADWLGTIHALDAVTGASLWTRPLETPLRAPFDRPPPIVGDDTHLYGLDGDNSVRKLDRRSGDVVAVFPLPDRPASDFYVTLHVTRDVLIAVSQVAQIPRPEPAVEADPPTAYVDALATDSGERLWQHRFDSVGPHIAITDTVIAISVYEHHSDPGTPSSENLNTSFHATFVALKTGEVVATYDPGIQSAGTVSASGDVICVNNGTAIACLDSTHEPRALTNLPYAPNEYMPILFWNDEAIALSREDGVMRIRPAAPSSPPVR